MPREILDVTLVIVDSVSGELARRAIERTIEQMQFGGAIWVYEDLPSIQAVEACMWNQIPQDIKTSHALFIQYDGWVLNGALWKDYWLQYDYIGAPWPWHRDGLNVGNGGFSLRSKKLMDFLATNRAEFPVITPEDDTLCRKYRRTLEDHGFRWAPYEVAADFSFERGMPRPTFGFHGIFNVPKVLNGAAFTEWKSLANDYVRSKVEWREIEPWGVKP